MLAESFLDELPFTGRETELETIERTYRKGDKPGILITGASGTGRTRMVSEALARLERAGALIERVSALPPVAAIPFAALAHLLPQGDAFGYDDPLAVLRAVTAEVERRRGGRSLVLGVDDGHLLDEGSLAVLTHLAKHRTAFLVCTVRTDTPRGAEKAELWKDCPAQRLELAPLRDAEVDRLLDAALPGYVDGPSRIRLRRAARGNPMALWELLHSGTRTRALRRRHRVWRWDGALPPNPRLAASVADALGRVRPGVGRLLEIVACAEPLEVRLLERLTGTATVEAAERAGLVAIERSRARLARPLHGEVLRAGLAPYRSRAIYRRLAGAVSEPHDRDGVLRAASWQLRGGAPDSPDLLACGARAALARGDHGLAEQLARTARKLAPGPRADLLLAEILLRRGDAGRAADLLARWPDATGTDWAAARATVLYWGRGQVAEAERELDRADGALAGAVRARILLFDGRCEESMAAAHRTTRRPPETGGVAAALLGRATEPGRHDGPATALLHLVNGDPGRARVLAEEGHAAASADGSRPDAASWAALRGAAAAVQGAVAAADASLREAIAAFEDEDPFQLMAVVAATLGGVSALAGDAAEADRWLARAEGDRSHRVFAPWTDLCRAWALAAHGSTTGAVTAALAAADLARSRELPVLEAVALYDTVRLSGGDQAKALHGRLGGLAARTGAPLIVLLADAATALARADRDALRRVADTLAARGHHLLACEAAFAAARVSATAGGRGSTVLDLERAMDLRSHCPDARTPMLSADGVTTQLTRREREVVLLAARHSSREIAHRLGLSVNTVNNYLARGYTKLGVSGRPGLRALLAASPSGAAVP